MYKGFVLSESLRNPLILNDFEKIYVKVERVTNGNPDIWHDFKLSIKDEDIDRTTETISKEIKDTWYAHFWNNREVYVILPNKVFKIPREKQWQSKEYQDVKKYALEHGVEERFLNFGLED